VKKMMFKWVREVEEENLKFDLIRLEIAFSVREGERKR
jgi:hypothetical protein